MTAPVTITEVVTPAPRAEWRSLAASDPSALADHHPAWTDAVVRSGRWRDASRWYRLSNGGSVVLPLVASTAVPGLSYYASQPTGWGFGGLVGDGAASPDVIGAVVADLVAQRWHSLRVRPDPQSGSAWGDAAPSGVATVARRAHLLDLTPGPTELMAAMRKSTRRAIRRAERDAVDIEVGHHAGLFEEYERLWRLSVDRWAVSQHEPLWLARRRSLLRDPPSRLRHLAAELGDRFCLWVAREGGEAIGANVVVVGPSTHIARAVMDRERVGSRGTMQYLDWLAIEAACLSGSTLVNLGESGGNESLAHYKESLGARPYDYTELRLERVPITRLDTAVRTGVKKLVGFTD
ncbi:MAG: GNAT family N-acetyltransferase [Acidimicrobiales bacterium]